MVKDNFIWVSSEFKKIFLNLKKGMENTNIKQEFILIQTKYLQSTPNGETMREMYIEYENLFLKSGLKDLQFEIIIPKENPCIMVMHPIRPIDKLAIRGILNLE